MSQTEYKVELISSEIANLWTSYMNDTMLACMLEVFLTNVEDQHIQSVIDSALTISNVHIKKITTFFNEEQLPIPDGFSLERDVNKAAPRLFTDDFYIFLLQNLGKIGMENYAYALSNSARLDISEFYNECLHESTKLYNKASEVMLSKGLFIRAPYIPAPKAVEYVKDQGYLTGFFGKRRALNVVEITNIYTHMIQNQLGRTVCMGFSQVAKSTQVRDYFIRGRAIGDKHVEIFGSILSEEFLPSASAWDTLPTDSTISPFSDKMLMVIKSGLNAAGIGHYGRSLGTSPRRDLGAQYARLIAEIGLYAEDGANILIKNNWMEQIPQAPDRDQLANKE